MANYGPVDAWLLVGGNDVTGDVFDMAENAEQVLEECHPLLGNTTGPVQDKTDKWVPVGMSKITLECGQGVYDTRAVGMLDALQNSGATRQLVNFGFAGTGDPVAHVGAECVMVDGTYAAAFTKKAQRGNITMGQAKHTLTGRRYPGKVISGLVTRSGATGDTKTQYLDYGAGSYGHAIFDLSVPVLTGSPTNVVVKVYSSPDHISWNLEATFAAVTAAGSAERKLVTSTIDRYLAIDWTFTAGTAPTTKALVSAYLYT